MSKFLRMTVLTIVMFAQLLAGVGVGAQAEAAEPDVSKTLTALSLLEIAETVVTKETEWGPSIVSINETEVKGDDYWGFYVNGGYAQEGVGTYEPQIGDVLTFKYEYYPEPAVPVETTTEETIKIVGLENNSTALSLLQKVEDVQVKEYDFGPMITAINGKEAYGAYWWSFSINGTSSTVGAGSYYPKHGDVLQFKFTDPDSNTKYTIAAVDNLNPSTEEPPIEDCENPIGDSNVDRAAKWVQISKTGVDQTIEALSLRHLGKAIPQSYFDKINEEIVNKRDKKIANYHNYILSLILKNQDPTNIEIEGNKYNLVEKIYNNPETGNDIYSLTNALIALDSNNYSIPGDALWTREEIKSAIIEAMIHNSNEKGLWSWSKDDSADLDTTAMVLTALAPYKNEPVVEDVIEKAVNGLSSIQLANGGFNGGSGENSSTAAYVLTALTALEIDSEGDEFTKSNGNLVDYVSSYILEDGSFSYNIDGDTDEVFATPQGLLALVSYERFIERKGSVYDLTDLPPLVIGEASCSGGGTPEGGSPTTPGDIKKQTITISVRTHESTILSTRTLEVNEGLTALSVLKEALGGRVDTSFYSSVEYVRAIDGLAEFDHGPTSGWKYSVNGYFPSSGAGTYRLSNGDQLEWVYVTDDPDAAKGKQDLEEKGQSEKPEAVSNEVFDSLKELKDDSQKQTSVLNKDQKMSASEAQKLKQDIAKNTVKVEKRVNPSEETVIADPSVQEAKIVIPKEALQTQTTIKIEELTTNENVGSIKVKSSIYQFLPKGIKFKTPAYISIKIPIEDNDLDNLVMAWFNEETNEWEDIPTVIDAKTGVVTGLVKHFTKFAIIDKSKNANDLDIKEEMNNLVTFLQNDETQSEWEDFGLALLNQSDEQKVLAGISENLKEVEGFFRKITDYERYVLTIKALDGDPTTIGGYNLIEKIYNNERMTMQGTNGLIFALIALDSGNYQVPSTAMWTREKTLAEILDSQNTDGGFSLVKGEASDVDITAMAISSLVPYKEQPRVKTAIDKAVNWLSKVQQESGGFIADGHENSESASQVIIGLTAAGIDPQGSLFTKANGNVVTNLLTYQNADGGFANLKNEESNQIASEQALMAMIALDRFHNEMGSIYQFEAPENIQEVEVVATIPNFADANQISSYAKQSVYDAYNRGVMRGVEVNPLRFAPKQNLTRAQFTAVLVTLLDGGTYEDTNLIFDDVKPGQWYYEPVMRAKEMGIVAGTSDTTFAPNAPITREQVALILARAFELKPNQEATGQSVYRDISTLNHGSQEAIQALYEHNLMNGYENGLFKPQDYVTREMGAALAIRIDDNF